MLPKMSTLSKHQRIIVQDVAEASRKAGEGAGNGAADAGIPSTVVRHMPLHAVALDADSFVLPAAGSAAARARTGAFPAGYHTPAGSAVAGMHTGSSVFA